MIIVNVLAVLVAAILTFSLLYYYALLIAGRAPRARSCDPGPGVPRLRFAAAVPAHNEEQVIGGTVTRLRQMDYPPDHFAVHVVADHCTDATAELARAAGATVHVRTEGPRGRKGYAVDWLARRLLADPARYDVIAVFDADSQVDPGFLKAVTQLFAEGAQAVQGQHVIANAHESLFNTLADADMRLNNRIRNQAKENLGLSARLMGDAMCFGRALLERYPWAGEQSLTEDRDYGIYLVTQGIRIRYASGAISRGEAAGDWRNAALQRMRWYAGVSNLRRRYVHSLWKQARREHSADALDKWLELVVPSYTWLSLASAVLFALYGLLWLSGLPVGDLLWVTSILFLLTWLFPVAGLTVADASVRSYVAVLAGPFYVVWRAWIGVAAKLRQGRVAWVRTRRSQARVPVRPS